MAERRTVAAAAFAGTAGDLRAFLACAVRVKVLESGGLALYRNQDTASTGVANTDALRLRGRDGSRGVGPWQSSETTG